MSWLLFIVGAVASGLLAVCFMFFKSFGVQDLLGMFMGMTSSSAEEQKEASAEA